MWLRIKTRLLVPLPIHFGPIAYWSRGFVSNRSRLLIGREHTATTSCKLLPLLLLEDCLRCFNETEDLHQKKNLVNNGKKTKLLEIALNGEKIDQIFYISFCKSGKNQSCLKLPEMARTLIENDFWNCWPTFCLDFSTPPPNPPWFLLELPREPTVREKSRSIRHLIYSGFYWANFRGGGPMNISFTLIHMHI